MNTVYTIGCFDVFFIVVSSVDGFDFPSIEVMALFGFSELEPLLRILNQRKAFIYRQSIVTNASNPV